MPVWFEPDYLGNFQCKAGRCRHTCCSGWNIQVGELEYFHLIGMNCSEDLHRRLESAFAVPEMPTEDAYREIRPNWLGNCPMLSEEGLCMLQQECGAEALPAICRVYPRSFRMEGKCGRAVCSGSCEAVIELLMPLERLSYHRVASDEAPMIREDVDDRFPELCLSCLQAVQNRSMALRTRIDSIARMLGCKTAVTASRVRKILPRMLEFSPELAPYLQNGTEIPAEDQPWEENVLANHLLFTDFPYTDRRITKADSAVGLLACYELMQMLKGNRGNALTDALAALFHLTEHTAFYYNAWLMLAGMEEREKPDT